MRQSIALLAMLSSMAAAADTIEFFYPGGSEGVDPVVTIKNVQPTVTEMLIACPTSVDSTDCGWGPGMNYTILSKTLYKASMSYDAVDMSMACDHNTQANEMTCTVSMSGGNVDSTEPQTAVLKGDEVVFNSATIVQGAGLLSAGDASATPNASPAASAASKAGASATATGTAKATGTALQALKTAASGSSTGTAAPAEHTGAAARSGLQGVAALALAGVVALVAL